MIPQPRNWIPQPRNWKVTFFIKEDRETGVGMSHHTKLSTVVFCVKRFAKSIANEKLGYPAYRAYKISVGLVK